MKQTKDREWVGGLIAMLMALMIAFSSSFTTNDAKPEETAAPIEANYKPGIARYVEYDYIRIDGATYIIFRDKYTNSIAVVPKY